MSIQTKHTEAFWEFWNVQEHSKEAEQLNIRKVVYNKGETIFKQSSFVSNICFIANGLTKQVQEGYNNRCVIIKFSASGEWIELQSAISQEYYSFTVTALKKTEIWLMARNTIQKEVQSNNDLLRKITTRVLHDYNWMENKINMFGNKQLHGRLAETILYLNQPELQAEDVFEHISRRETAEFAGMSVESMLRILNEFKNDKIVEISDKKIIISNMVLLKKLSQAG